MNEFNENEKREASDNLSEKFVVSETVEIEQAPNTVKKSVVNEIFEWIEVLITAVIAVVILFTLFFRVATIDGPSMMNTLHNGERVIITNFLYTPKRGDIVVISRNESNSVSALNSEELPIIKRIIATEGQEVNIDFEEGVVYVDGKALDEPYALEPTTRKFDVEFPLTVSPGCVFVLGDNRNNSKDSRDSTVGHEGMVDTRYILGHAVYRIFPFEKVGGLG